MPKRKAQEISILNKKLKLENSNDDNKKHIKPILSKELVSTITSNSYNDLYNDVHNVLIGPKKESGKSTKKQREKEVKKVINEKVLSKKQRKNLERIVKTKTDNEMKYDLYEKLREVYKSKPEDVMQDCISDLKKSTTQIRKNLTEKIKPNSRRQLKKWKLPKPQKPTLPVKPESPNTSDFSSDDLEPEQEAKQAVSQDDEKPSNVNVAEEPMEVEETVVSSAVDPEVELKKETKVILKPRPSRFVLVKRTEEIDRVRETLPIVAEEAAIMEAISENDVVVISGATGSGKTTQVPQFLYEAGYAREGKVIGVTEPRRVAAMSMAERVAVELNSSSRDNIVSYHIRFDNTASCTTRIKFMTDGVLLQELKENKSLRKYSAIIVDEAHERSVFSDLLLGFLARVVRCRRQLYEQLLHEKPDEEPGMQPLKLIIMSATLRVQDFSENSNLFHNPPPVINIPGRMFPIQIHFERSTPRTDGYLQAVYKKTVMLHEKMPTGTILVFVTGQREVEKMCQWLRCAFPVTQRFLERIKQDEGAPVLSTNQSRKLQARQTQLVDNEKDPITKRDANMKNFNIIPEDEEADIFMEATSSDMKEEEELDEDEQDEERMEEEWSEAVMQFDRVVAGVYRAVECEHPVLALPLYSMLPATRQHLVFEPAPTGQRMIVVATNVAETLAHDPRRTIRGRLRSREKKCWNVDTGLSRFEVARISQSSAQQRAGRAGRVCEGGMVYRMYSSAVYQGMSEHTPPQILSRPVEDVLLMAYSHQSSKTQIKGNALPPLPTMPAPEAVRRAERDLLSLRALRPGGPAGKLTLTPHGRQMSRIPLPPRFAHLLLRADQFGVLDYAAAIVSVLTVSNFFSIDKDIQEGISDKTKNFKHEFIKKDKMLPLGDISVLLGAISKLEHVRKEHGVEKCREVAEAYGVRWRALEEVRDLRSQLSLILNKQQKQQLRLSQRFNPELVLAEPNPTQVERLRRLLLLGSPANVGVLNTEVSTVAAAGGSRAHRDQRMAYRVADGSHDQLFHISPHSVLHAKSLTWIVFQEMFQSDVYAGNTGGKPTLKVVSSIEPEWLPMHCPLDCRCSGLVLTKEMAKQIARDAGGNSNVDDRIAALLPQYDAAQDAMMVWSRTVLYGQAQLELPRLTKVPIVNSVILADPKNDLVKVHRWLARFLVDGSLFPDVMRDWLPWHREGLDPEHIVHQAFGNRSEIFMLVRELSNLKDLSAAGLRAHWKTNTNFLLNSYLQWVMPKHQSSVRMAWPPCVLQKNAETKAFLKPVESD